MHTNGHNAAFIYCSLFVIVLAINLNSILTSGAHKQKRYAQEDICNSVLTTVESVDSCPANESQLQDRRRKKNCQIFKPCHGKLLVYHCVRYDGRLAEVCAPRGFIIGKCCALLDKGLGRVIEDYHTPCSDCPFRYYSNESLLYSPCAKPTGNAKTSRAIQAISKGPCNRKRTRRSIECKRKSIIAVFTTVPNPTTVSKNFTEEIGNKNKRPKGGNNTPVYAYVIIVVAGLVFIGVTLIALAYTRRKSKDALCQDWLELASGPGEENI